MDYEEEYDPLQDTGSTEYFLEQQRIKAEEERKAQEEAIKNAYICKIYYCENCGFCYDETESSSQKISEKYTKYKNEVCPKCGKKLKVYIPKDAKDRLKILQEIKAKKIKKEVGNKNSEYTRIKAKKLEKDLVELSMELSRNLDNGEITPDQYAQLIVNLSYRIYRYYTDPEISRSVDGVRNFARSMSKIKLQQFYGDYDLDKKLDELLAEYDEEQKNSDIIYLKYCKKIDEENSLSDPENASNIQKSVKELGEQIKKIEEYNDEVKRANKQEFKTNQRSEEGRLADSLRKLKK